MHRQRTVLQLATARCASLRCSICAELSPQAKEEMARLSRIRTFRAGETILAEEDEIDYVGHVMRGVLRMQKTLPDGRQQVVGLLLPPDMFGRVFAQISHVGIEASTDVTLCCYSRASLEHLFVRFPELERRFLVSISQQLDVAQDWMLLLANKSVNERMATFLLNLARKRAEAWPPAGDNDPLLIEMPVARKDVAAYLGTTIESISRSIHWMSRIGLIRIVDSHRFQVTDLRRLVALSGQELDVSLAYRRHDARG